MLAPFTEHPAGKDSHEARYGEGQRTCLAICRTERAASTTAGARSDAASCGYGAARSRHGRSRTLLRAATVALTLGAPRDRSSAASAAAARSRVGLQLPERSRLPDPNAHRRRSHQILRIGIQIRGSRIQRSQLQIGPLDLQRARLRPHERLPLLDRAQREPRCLRPARSSRSTTPAPRRRWGSSKATRPKAAAPRTAPSTPKGTTGSPTATAQKSPMRSTSAKSK